MAVSLLNESEAVWDVGAPVLEIREQSTISASQALVAAMPEDIWAKLGLTVTRAPGETAWSVRSSDIAGVARLELPSGSTHVRITPKIPQLDLFFLADWAFGSSATTRAVLDQRADLDALREEPAACLLGWYLAEVIAFATRWVRRGYVAREEDLVGRIRGRIDVARYVSRSLSSARPHVIPSRFTEPSHDTDANRYLKTGVRQAARLARALPNAAARRFLLDLARRGQALLAGVDDVEMTPEQGRRLNLGGPLRHYRAPVAFTTALLDGTYVSTAVGQHSQAAVAWPLNGLYEQALRNVLAEWTGALLDRNAFRATIETTDGVRLGSSAVVPDYVMRRPDGSRLVLDAKYKDVRSRSSRTSDSGADKAVDVAVSPRQNVRVRRSDVYQAVAYGRHSGLAPTAVVLVYPVALLEGDPYPEAVRVAEFDPKVHAVFFDVGPTAGKNLALLYQVLESLPAA